MAKEQTTHRPIAAIERDWHGCSQDMALHYAIELIQALYAREASLLEVVRYYNPDDEALDHEKVIQNG